MVGRSASVTGDEAARIAASPAITTSVLCPKAYKQGGLPNPARHCVTGTMVGRSAQVTGDEFGSCHRVTGDQHVLSR